MNDYRTREKIYDVHYRATGYRGDPCTYCGQVSDTLDHIPPLYIAHMLSEAGQQGDGPFIKVPSCRECNSALTSVRKYSVVDRRAYVRDFLRRKYRKFLKIPHWDDDELSELDPSFAREVAASVRMAEHVRARLRWMR